ncbi:MAG TPA: plastocyanin/azurin family copper-binding protein [Burkholderiaceae bacterium]|nr:plastocyanin/azurin family copper-binding protein [Burkholderiaceae bacterium]
MSTCDFLSPSKRQLKSAIKNMAFLAVFVPATTLSLAAALTVNVVDKDGKATPDAVVFISTTSATTAKSSLPKASTITQTNMQFLPAVTVVQPGSKITFTNNDPWDHHVRGSAAGAAQFGKNDENGFALRLAGKSLFSSAKSSVVSLDKPGVVLLGCHIHGSMVGHIVVSDTPWATKTDASGNAVFNDLPDGAVTVKVWHAAQFVDLKPTQTTLSATPSQIKMQLTVTPPPRRTPAKPSEYDKSIG